MTKAKQKRLEAKGWKVGTTDEFLQLTPEESTYIELKLQLTQYLKRFREDKKLTQIELARMIHSSQSRVAKMEAGDPSVSLDLIVRSLLALGASRRQLGTIIRQAS